MANASTQTRERALSLLSSGVSPVQVAAACGVTESAISQLNSDPDFTAELALRKYSILQAHNVRDNAYDEMEDKLLAKLQSLLPLMMRPLEVLKALQVINAAKRRGQSAPDQIIQQQTIVNIQLPTVLANKFTINPQGQVIEAGSQSLETIQSNTLLKHVKGNLNDELSQRALSNSTGAPKELA